MSIRIDKQLCNLCGVCATRCPFGALECVENEMQVNAACKLCGLCVKACPNRAITLCWETVHAVDKSQWSGVLVCAEFDGGRIHPVTYELIGKAKELANVTEQKVYAVLMGEQVQVQAKELLHYGVEKVFVYDNPSLRYFREDVYANALEDCITRLRPCAVLIGATPIGRSLAPRVATRFRSGLTADCTTLQMRKNTDLVQIRPAFGGNIMAQILTTNHRPQFATVRYKVMDAAPRAPKAKGCLETCWLPEEKLRSVIHVESVDRRPRQAGITEAEVIVVAGRGVKTQEDLSIIQTFAELLGGQFAVTRPLVEMGWADYTRQIGLSGRTVKPKLIITCGVSGAIQFVAGMKNAGQIIAINTDPEAPIFSVAHQGFVGDLYEILPSLIERIKDGERDAV